MLEKLICVRAWKPEVPKCWLSLSKPTFWNERERRLERPTGMAVELCEADRTGTPKFCCGKGKFFVKSLKIASFYNT